ncbi:hypothetical protein ACU21_01575 [Actinobaculum suis]|uniref:hypothetical protein n=1 Tax=Actinobaculum suis TaxID=1657 RepID=UPI00066FC136|nr:hypothetical protein [Actinobaculum suis]KMY22746.1 hypothetical protein ACU19_08320 [Actinobaculum suis]OCA93164.1 hypothetical protein ACU21_01575 [Actinobaculum suis]
MVLPDFSVIVGGLNDLAGILLAIGILVCTAGLFYGAGLWAIGALSASPEKAEQGKKIILNCLVGAFVCGSIVGVIFFFLK